MTKNTTEIRADLDAAIAAALPLANGRVRAALHKLRKVLDQVDQCNAVTKERLKTLPGTTAEDGTTAEEPR